MAEPDVTASKAKREPAGPTVQDFGKTEKSEYMPGDLYALNGQVGA